MTLDSDIATAIVHNSGGPQMVCFSEELPRIGRLRALSSAVRATFGSWQHRSGDTHREEGHSEDELRQHAEGLGAESVAILNIRGVGGHDTIAIFFPVRTVHISNSIKNLLHSGGFMSSAKLWFKFEPQFLRQCRFGHWLQESDVRIKAMLATWHGRMR